MSQLESLVDDGAADKTAGAGDEYSFFVHCESFLFCKNKDIFMKTSYLKHSDYFFYYLALTKTGLICFSYINQ